MAGTEIKWLKEPIMAITYKITKKKHKMIAKK
jgi:hypothetical protein